MTISWNAPEPESTIRQLELFTTPENVESNTWSPGTVFKLNEEEYALTLDQDETTVTYFVIRRGLSVTKTHDEFRTDVTP